MNWTTSTCVQCDYFDREFGDCLSRSSDRFQTSAHQPACSLFAKDTGNLKIKQSHQPLVHVDVEMAKADPFATLRMLGQRFDGVDIDTVHRRSEAWLTTTTGAREDSFRPEKEATQCRRCGHAMHGGSCVNLHPSFDKECADLNVAMRGLEC